MTALIAALVVFAALAIVAAYIFVVELREDDAEFHQAHIEARSVDWFDGLRRKPDGTTERFKSQARASFPEPEKDFCGVPSHALAYFRGEHFEKDCTHEMKEKALVHIIQRSSNGEATHMEEAWMKDMLTPGKG